MINQGTAFTANETITDERIAESPLEIREGVTVEIAGTGTLISRSLTVATANTDIELYVP